MVAAHRAGPLGEIVCLRGESFVVSGPDGDVLPAGDHGLYVRDTRMLDRLELLVDGRPPRPLAGRSVGDGHGVFHAWVPVTDATVDPTVLVTRRRTVRGGLHEEVLLENRGTRARAFEVRLRCGTDFAYVFDVKHGRHLPRVEGRVDDGRLVFEAADGPTAAVVRGHPAGTVEADGWRWEVRLEPGGSVRCDLEVEATDVYGTATAPTSGAVSVPTPRSPAPAQLEITCTDEGFTRLVTRSLEDLRALRLRDPLAPDDRFLAAGSPWYLTLFGRDALWSARMLLPLDLKVAGGTLRALARRQGRRYDTETEEAPGKILHELRRGSLAHRGDLPPNYYGSVDATLLFVVLLHEAWRWGLPEAEVLALLPAAEAALGWLRDDGDPRGTGFVHYWHRGGRGLANQGWKDSHDGVRFADGRLPEPPIALAEVQGYAFEAALRGAALLDAFDRPGAELWRDHADALRRRFAARFWVEDERGPYPAMALDGHGSPVDAPASNMGHLLASGMLDEHEAAAVARRLGDPSLASGWGLRTMATTAIGYNPLSYHCGSVWPHDTAIAAWGCALTGHREVAANLLGGLVAAAPSFRHRLPELFAGLPRTAGDMPVPYPMACRPQAWAAAASVLLLKACLRPRPQLPDGRLTLSPLWPPPFRRLTLHHLPIAGGYLDLRIDADRGVDHTVRGSGLDVSWDLDVTDVPAY